MRRLMVILFIFVSFAFSLTRESAENFVCNELLEHPFEGNMRIWVHPEKFEINDIISTYMGDINVPISGWCFYIDDRPGAFFTHPVRFIFVSDENYHYEIIDWNYSPEFLLDMNEITSWWTEPEMNLPSPEIIENLKRQMAPAEDMDADNLYAVLLNGGGDMGSNYMAFYIDLSWCYTMLKEVYGYNQENIYVLCSDGTNPAADRCDGSNSPPDMDGDGVDDIEYAATWPEFNSVITELSGRLGANDQLYFFYIDHGTDVDSLITGLCMWDGIRNDYEFAELVEPLPCGIKLVTITACFSGGFIDDFAAMDNTVINTAARFDEYAWGMPGDVHGFYSYYILSALSGDAPLGEHDPSTADLDGNGFISIYESYLYACLHDSSDENPQFASNPPELGENSYVFGSTFNQPYFDCDSPNFVDATGDGDGLLDPGELIEYHPNIVSTGDTAYNLDVELECDDPFVTLESYHFTRDYVLRGDEGITMETFEFDLADDIPWGYEFDMNISFHAGTTSTDFGSYSRDFPINLRVVKPMIQVDSYGIIEVVGNGDGIIDAGETIDIRIDLYNDSQQELDDVDIELHSITSDAHVSSGDASFGLMNPFSEVTTSDLIRVSVDSDVLPNSILSFNMDVTGDSGFDEEIPFALQVGNYFIPEDDPGVWIADGWQLCGKRNINNMMSWYNGNSGTFTYNDGDTMNLTSCTFVIPPDDPVLLFDQFLACEIGYDKAYVQISTDGGLSWDNLLQQSSYKSSWISKFISIPAEYAGRLAKLRFRFESNRSVHGEGWYLSNIHVIPKPQAYVGSGYCFPYIGAADMEFGFHATYYNTDLLPLTSADVVVDGVSYPMTTLSGMASTGIRYYALVTLAEGNHSWHVEMRYDGGFERYPSTGEFEGPFSLYPVQTYEIGHFHELFEPTGANDVWEYGVPSGAPSSEIPFGTSVWGTDLSGVFPCGLEGTTSRLEMPPIALPDDFYPVIMLYHWYETGSFINSMIQGGGNVKVSIDGGEPFVVMPEPRITSYDFIGYDGIAASGNGQIGWEQGFGGNGIGANWAPTVFDLSFVDGDEMQIFFDFGASVTCDAASALGWYINNVYLFNRAFTDVQENPREIPEELNISVSPNPFNSACRVEYMLDDLSQPINISVYGISGNKVYSDFVTSPIIGHNEFVWNADEISSGVYFIEIVGSKTLLTKALLIK